MVAVAIYHFSAKIISRANGSSALAAAAYRSASRLYDQRLDRHHDFSNKAGIVHSEVMLPDGAPERLGDRETLWNEVEAVELRKDAQLAREIEFAIPRELSPEMEVDFPEDDKGVVRVLVHDLVQQPAHTLVECGILFFGGAIPWRVTCIVTIGMIQVTLSDTVSGDLAAIGVEDFSHHELGILEIEHGLRNILDLSHPAHRVGRRQRLVHLGGIGVLMMPGATAFTRMARAAYLIARLRRRIESTLGE